MGFDQRKPIKGMGQGILRYYLYRRMYLNGENLRWFAIFGKCQCLSIFPLVRLSVCLYVCLQYKFWDHWIFKTEARNLTEVPVLLPMSTPISFWVYIGQPLALLYCMILDLRESYASSPMGWSFIKCHAQLDQCTCTFFYGFCFLMYTPTLVLICSIIHDVCNKSPHLCDGVRWNFVFTKNFT